MPHSPSFYTYALDIIQDFFVQYGHETTYMKDLCKVSVYKCYICTGLQRSLIILVGLTMWYSEKNDDFQ